MRFTSLLLVFLFLSLGVAVTSYVYYDQERRSIHSNAADQLSAIAAEKVELIVQWRKQQFSDVDLVFGDPLIRAAIRRVVQGVAAPAESAEVFRWMQVVVRHAGYASVALVDASLRPRLEVTPGIVGPHATSMAAEAVKTGKPVFEELHRSSGYKEIHLEFALPVLSQNDQPAVGALIVWIDPRDSLFPEIETWPLPHRTAEALLVRREGEDVLFLSRLRGRKDAALSLRLPVRETRIPAVRAALGYEGIVDGVDYRGVPVLAATRKIPGSAWSVVAKIDKSEVFADLGVHAWAASLGAALIIALLGACLLLIRHELTLREARQRLKADQERKALLGHFDYLSRYANDIILLTDEQGRIIEANERAVATYGFSREELLASTSRDLRAPEALATFEQQQPTSEGAVYETTHRRKDGTTFPVEISSRRIVVDGREFRQAIIRDITERRRAEAALRESERRYRSMIETLGEGIIIVDANQRFLLTNPAAEKILGATEGTLAGHSVREFVAPNDLERVEGEMARRRAGDSSDYELDAVRADGAIRRVHLTATPVFESGRFTGALGVLRDITDSRRMEARVRLLAHAVQSADDCISITDVNDNLLFVNPAFCRTYGYEEQEVVGRHVGILRAERSNPEVVGEILPATLKGGWQGELWNRAKNGREFPISLTTSVVRDEDGKPIALVGVARDISARKAAEEALRESEHWLRESQSISQTGSYVLDVPSGYWTSSPTLDEIFGIARDDVKDVETWARLLHPEHREQMLDYLRNEVLGQGRPFDREYMIVRANDGETRWVNGRGALFKDENGNVVKMAGTIQDITERKRAEGEAAKLADQLQQSQKMESIGRLAGGIAHDFNNLLTVINGYSDLVMDSLPPGDALREQTAHIRAAGARAAELTGQLLAFSRKQASEPRVMDLNRLILSTLEMLRRLVGENIEIIAKLEPSLGHVVADHVQLDQVLMNLAVNAKDAMPAGGRLTIETSNSEVDGSYAAAHAEARPGSYVLLSVSDTGAGMDEEVRRHVFEPFFTTKEEGKGTGLGLSTVYGIVRQCGGWIWVYSEPGLGSTFKIYLPRTSEPVEERAAPSRAAAASRGNETILVAEDQDIVRQLSVTVLAGRGYRVLQAASGEEALRVAGTFENSIHLLLTDVVMPGMTGRDLAERLLPSRPGMSVLYMSGYTDDVISREGMLDPDVNYIGKPFSPEALCEKVRGVLDAHSAPKRILVVDDEPGIRALFQSVLEQAGYQVSQAADGNQALDAARSAKFDLVLMDLVMPEREGIETIREMRRELPGLKMIAISGAFSGTMLRAAEALGADASLPKPVNPAQLLDAVRKVLG